jgi:hypothetical protein
MPQMGAIVRQRISVSYFRAKFVTSRCGFLGLHELPCADRQHYFHCPHNEENTPTAYGVRTKT